ncbi:immunity 8 family protein [Brucella gallinifaecis]|uniref:immunity 8 family protein n=1 Tax=Brucella gallinifaecis TaxID=215590 RepID=UPI00236014CD|nr:immunity 8 family protein [Brucella gallinifaecis]
MRGIIKSIELVDHENWEYWPDDPTNFCVAAEALIGPEDGAGQEIFSFEVCTPRWLEEHGERKPHFVRHVILMHEYDEDALKSLVRRVVENTNGATWSEVAEKLARYMFWEFEDYQS